MFRKYHTLIKVFIRTVFSSVIKAIIIFCITEDHRSGGREELFRVPAYHPWHTGKSSQFGKSLAHHRSFLVVID